MSFNPDSQENQLLFARAKSGSAAFAQELLKQQTNDMYYLARAYLSNAEDAKMAVRMGFSKALKRLNTIDDVHEFSDWLANIVRLTAVGTLVPLETEKTDGRYTRLDERPAENVSFPSEETCQKQFLQVLNLLNDSERAAAAARYYDHMEVEDCASLLRLSVEDVEALLVNAKKKLTENKVDISEFTALAEFINPSARLEKTEPEEETLILDDEPRKNPFAEEEKPAVQETETPAVKEEKEEPVDETFEAAQPLKRQDRRRAQPQPAAEEDDDDDDDIDYDDDEGYDDYDYDRKGRRKRHKSHIVLKIILILILILAIIGALLFGIYKVDQDLFYSIPGTTRLVTVLENITGKDIEQPYENTAAATATPESTVEPTAEATAEATAAPTEGLISGTETGTDTAVGNVQIQLEAVNVRSDHDAASEQVGTVYQGETYDVYGVFKASDYTWYRIGEGMWVADDGSYLTYTALN